MSQKTVFGLDLGTTNTRISALCDASIKLIPDAQGHFSTPSVFSLNSSQEVSVGYEALSRAKDDRLNTVYNVNRLLGINCSAQLIAWAETMLPFKLTPSPKGQTWVELHDHPTNPSNMLVLFIEHAKLLAEAYVKQKMQDVSLVVPTHYNTQMRKIVTSIAKHAGLNVIAVADSTTSAALSYWFTCIDEKDRNKPRILAVVDFGGGSLNVALLSIKNGTMEILASLAEPFLGGEEITQVIIDIVAQKMKSQASIDITQDPTIAHKLRQAAERAKHILSTEKTAPIDLPYIQMQNVHNMQGLSIVLDRKSFEQRLEPYLNKLKRLCLQALKDSGVRKENLSDLLLVGGSSNIPVVRHCCEESFGVSACKAIDRDNAIVVGAAVYGALRSGIIEGLNISDVVPATLCIEAQSGICLPIIQKNTKIPATGVKHLTTSGPNQKKIDIKLFQGSSSYSDENLFLGSIELSNLPMSPRGGLDVIVTVGIDTDSTISLLAMLSGSNIYKQLIISPDVTDSAITSNTSDPIADEDNFALLGLNLDKVSGSILSSVKSEQPQEQPQVEIESESPEVAKERHLLRSLVFETQFKLDSEGKRFKGKQREQLDAALASARKLLDRPANLAIFQTASEALKKHCEALDEFLSE